MIQKLNINDFLLQSAGHPVIDVRSPAEYHHAHIPGAVSLPLFNDDERATIGTLYKQKGREAAMMKGLENYGTNMQRILRDLENITADKALFVHCWRGGMRSGVVAWMLDLFGYKVCTLDKGYKAFRASVLDSFNETRKLLILGGKTGSAKTAVIQELLQQSQQVIDLEQLACHKGSAFGALGEAAPPSQEQFENDLFMKFRITNAAIPVVLEDESQRIGPVNIPNALWAQMRSAPVLYLEIPFEERLQHLVKNYGGFALEDLKASTLRIRKRLGGLQTTNTIQLLENGEHKNAFSILLQYYDRTYMRATEQRNASLIHRIESTTTDAATNASLVLQAMNSGSVTV